MAKALQCPACGHMHRLDVLTGVPTFPCETCGRTLRTPDEYVRPPGMAPRVPARASSVPPPAPAGTAAATAAATATGSQRRGARAPEPALAHRLAAVTVPLRVTAWIAAVGLGGIITFLATLALGFLSKQRLVDMFSSSRPMNYVRLFALVPVWALVTATLATALIEGTRWTLARRAARATHARGSVSTARPDRAVPPGPPATPSAEAPPPGPVPTPGERTRIRPREPTP